MNRLLVNVAFSLVFLVLLQPWSHAEENQVKFTPGRITPPEHSRPPLRHAAMVAEFTDPAASGLGASPG